MTPAGKISRCAISKPIAYRTRSKNQTSNVRKFMKPALLLLAFAQIPHARADSASCLAKITSYVAELDVLLLEVRNNLAPYNELSERYFPFRDCEADALLEVVRRSKFIRAISHSAREGCLFHTVLKWRCNRQFYVLRFRKKIQSRQIQHQMGQQVARDA